MIEIRSVNGAVLYTAQTATDIRTALVEAVKSRADLAGANLAGADLTRANLTRANLTRAYLAGANLAGADLTGAYLAGANLAGAYLTRANLAGADLAGAYLAGANLTRAYLTRADLAGADLAGADLTGAYLAGAIGDFATAEESDAMLVRIAEIVLAQPARLAMETWHGCKWDSTHTPEEEQSCGTPHCLAGWAQALCPLPFMRRMDPQRAGYMLIPTAAHLFSATNDEAREFLEKKLAESHAKTVIVP